MTARQMFEYALIELNKVEAPSLLLEDYNYFINKAVQQYVNKVYNAYELDQQRTDDLRVLKSSAVLTPIQLNEATTANLYNADYTVELPDNYFHVLSCVVEYSIEKEFKCYEKNTTVQFGAKRLTADMFSGIINNYYMRPMYKRPYFYVNNSGYDFIKVDHIKPEDATDNADEHDSNFIGTNSKNEVTHNKHVNYLDIRYGKDHSVFKLSKVYVDFLKTPQVIKLKMSEVNQDVDSSQIVEFPEYVCHEIINELVKLLMENAMDPRLQSNIPINQTIAPPAQQQQQGGK